MNRARTYTIVFHPRFEKILARLSRREQQMCQQVLRQIGKIIREPTLGKPLRNVLRNYRRVHVGSFVVLYEIYGNQVRFLDFDHHDRIYKRYS